MPTERSIHGGSEDGERRTPGFDLGWHKAWEGEPMDWLGCFGAGALLVGIAAAAACEFVIRVCYPDGYTPMKCLREMFSYHPLAAFIGGIVVCYVTICVIARKP